MRSRGSNGTGDTVPAGLVAAGVFGAFHAGFSIYWSIGGTWLLPSLGSNLLARLQGWEWILAPIGLVKLIGALAPIALARKGWPVRLLTRSACWLGTVALMAWGGVNTVVGNLVLAGVIQPRPVTIVRACSATPTCGIRCSSPGVWASRSAFSPPEAATPGERSIHPADPGSGSDTGQLVA